MALPGRASPVPPRLASLFAVWLARVSLVPFTNAWCSRVSGSDDVMQQAAFVTARERIFCSLRAVCMHEISPFISVLNVPTGIHVRLPEGDQRYGRWGPQKGFARKGF